MNRLVYGSMRIKINQHTVNKSVQKIAQTLRVARADKNLTQQALGSASGVSYVTISNIENGVVRPHRSTQKKIEEVVGVVDWVRTFSEGLIHGKTKSEQL